MKQDKGHPPSSRKVLFCTGSDGDWHEGFYLKDARQVNLTSNCKVLKGFVRLVNSEKQVKGVRT